jgi:cobalt-zinc-cadmium efflux system outer membrane protein
MKQRFPTHFAAGVAALLLSALPAGHAQQGLTWEQVKSRFESANPSLKANALAVQEARAQEITAYLRPNPQFSLSTDGTQIVPDNGVWKPFAGTDFVPNVS